MRTMTTKWIGNQSVLDDFTAGYVEGKKKKEKRDWIVYILHQKEKLLRMLGMAGTRPSREETTYINVWMVYTLHLQEGMGLFTFCIY